MKRAGWLAVAATLMAGAAPAASQELRGFLVLEGNPGYLTNAYLAPDFATWAPHVETAFGTLGSTGILEWTAERTSLVALGDVRWMGFADSTRSWRSYLLRGRLEQRLSGRLSAGLDGSFSDIRRPTDRQTVLAQAFARWTASPRFRLTVAPGVAFRRFGEVAGPEEEPPEIAPPELPVPPLSTAPSAGGGSGAAGATPRTTSYLLLVGAEGWPGSRWQVEGEAFGGYTEAAELGLAYRGAGGQLRLTRWFARGVRLGIGAGVEGFGYQAAEGPAGPAEEVPEDDLIWRGELWLGWPVGRRAELRARVAGLGRSGTEDGEGPDYYASAGLRLTLGGRLAPSRSEPAAWTRTEEGMRIRVPYDGSGRLYLVGDFNAWAEPGIPLVRVDARAHEATVRLEPGSYRYRIRVADADGERWLPLPEGTPAVEDGFGGRNGVVVVGSEEESRDDASR